MAVDGNCAVAGIARQTYKQGWNFLSLWEGFGVWEATWEPMSAFIQPDGGIHPVFRSYLFFYCSMAPSYLGGASRISFLPRREQ